MVFRPEWMTPMNMYCVEAVSPERVTVGFAAPAFDEKLDEIRETALLVATLMVATTIVFVVDPVVCMETLTADPWPVIPSRKYIWT